MNEVGVNFVGNLTAAPEAKTTKAGEVFVKLRVAVNERRLDLETDRYVDVATSYFDVTAYGALAQNCLDTLQIGNPVMVSGILRISQWTNDKGEPRTSPEVRAIHVGPDLKYATGTFARRSRLAREHPQPHPQDRTQADEQTAAEQGSFEHQAQVAAAS